MDKRLMVVDDSAFMRKIISDSIKDVEGIKVAGIARNGIDALEKIDRLKPDIITLDIEMPKLNGIETLKEIKNNYDIPVIMLSSITKTDTTIKALELGAIDFIEKPENLNENLDKFKNELELKVGSLVACKNCTNNERKKISLSNDISKTNAIVIGASTGGPKALVYLIENLPSINIPIFITQHMPKGFTLSFAERLDKLTGARVVEAKDNMKIENGTIYIAPGDFHMRLENGSIKLSKEEKLHGVRPAVDYLFESAAKTYREKLVGIILTGMGRDGTDGMKKIKEKGGTTIAQDEATSVVFGMPGSAIENGLVDEVLSLENISKTLNNILRVK
ncbi:MAG: protein-glutamate methylesterase/protein-glutamine glutaminase [Tissierella sp.]|uniref:protein-glutamate methylesterase/protein-glutamine glutaminase n=1 Tax=Tissierella sp. TaxID=41274 RepID=UPI003F9B1944